MLDYSELKLIHVASQGQLICEQHYVDMIQHECQKILASGHRLAANYSWDNLQVREHQNFDMLLHGDEIVTWCGLYNGLRYPAGVFRIMNRLYLNPLYRQALYPAYARDMIYPYQLAQNVDKIKVLFLSRDDIKGKFHLKRWVKYHCGEPGWRVSKNMVQVSDCRKRSCYQYIAFKTREPVDWFPDTVTEAQWLELPE
jgi:hypothetical protein